MDSTIESCIVSALITLSMQEQTKYCMADRVNDPVAYKNSNIYDVKSLQKTN